MEERKAHETNIKLQETGTLTGKVTSAVTGLGLAGVHVRAEGFGYGEAVTNSQGEYTIEGLAPSQYEVTYYSENNIYVYQYFSITIAKGNNVKNVVLREGGKITGLVTDTYTHAGLGKIGVYAYTPTGGYEGYAVTNERGEYTITGLQPARTSSTTTGNSRKAEYKAFEKAPV